MHLLDKHTALLYAEFLYFSALIRQLQYSGCPPSQLFTAPEYRVLYKYLSDVL